VTTAEIVIGNDVILDGEGNLTVDGNQAHRVLSVRSGVTAELRAMTVTGGLTYEGGGGIYNSGVLTLTNSTVSGNTAEFWPYTSYGGGIYSSGTLTLMNSTVANNTSYGSGGGIDSWGVVALTNSTVSGNTASDGGGLWSDGTLTLTNTTVSGNTAEYFGGGIESQSGTLTLTNSTVSGNTAEGWGGGISTSGTLTLANSTVSGNTAELFGGGAINTWGGEGTLKNSLIDGDCQGYYNISGGYNIESPGDTCGFDQGTDLVNITEGQLDLEPLADNDGSTMTHALSIDSVALDRIPEVDCEVETDQRGQPRPETDGTMCDVGSFERQPEDL
jgi:predicted outer membrane repeat protein